MRRYPIAEARANLPTIVDEVEAGNEVEITRRGKPVAVVVSRQRYDQLRAARRRFAERYRTFVARFPLVEVGADPATFQGLRDRAPGRTTDL